MFNPAPPIRTKIIEAQAVYFLIDFINEPILQDCPLSRVNNAFKNGILNPLSVVLTCLRDAIQTTRTFRICCGDIVTDYYEHHFPPYFQIKGG
jgi:hypothetical protein